MDLFSRLQPLLNHSLVFYSMLSVSAFFSSTSLGQDLQAIEAKLAINEQIAQYSYRWDSKDSDGFANLFTEDGTLERWVRGELVKESLIQGREAIMEYAIQSHSGRLSDRQTRHHVSNIVFLALDSTSAITEHMALITHQTEESGRAFISGSGIYRIHWKKIDEGWKMSKRKLSTDTPPSADH